MSRHDYMRKLNFSAVVYSSLSNNDAHQFAMEHALRIYRSHAIYTFIPKNACSTMRLSLAIENGCIEDPSDYRWIHENNRTFNPDLASLVTASYTFVILRCPFSRLASVYIDKIVGREPAGIKFAAMLGNLVDIREITFNSFITAMQDPAYRKGNVHWRPQNDFLVYKQYDDYFCVEEFITAITRIKHKTNMQIYDARGLTGHGMDKLNLSDYGDYSNIPAHNIQKMKMSGKSPSPRCLYNEKLISIVANTYKEDIALYEKHFGRKNLLFG